MTSANPVNPQHRTLLPLMLVVGLLGPACVVRMNPGPGPVGSSPAPLESRHGITRDEAISIAMNEAGRRSLNAQPKEAKLDDRKWKVELAVWRGEQHGELKLHIDASTGQLLKVKEKFKKDKHGRGHDKHGDHDHDDDERDDD
jgi:hypothetical protein